MVKLILIRHGITQWNASGKFQGHSDIPLADEGIKQAEKLAQNFPLAKVDHIYTSPLIRAKVTGETVAKQFNLPITTDPRLMEINFGKWESLTMEEINQHWADELSAMFTNPATAKIPEGESFPQVQARAMSFIEEISAKHQGETVAIFAHGGILRTIICAMAHIPLDYIWNLRQDNTAVNVAVKYPDNPNYIIELLNSTAHLQTIPSSTKNGL